MLENDSIKQLPSNLCILYQVYTHYLYKNRVSPINISLYLIKHGYDHLVAYLCMDRGVILPEIIQLELIKLNPNNYYKLHKPTSLVEMEHYANN